MKIPVKTNRVTKAPARVSVDQEANFETIPDFPNSISPARDLLIEVYLRSRVRLLAQIVRWSPLFVVDGEWSP